jgi:hypothetical protein
MRTNDAMKKGVSHELTVHAVPALEVWMLSLRCLSLRNVVELGHVVEPSFRRAAAVWYMLAEG